MAEDEDGPSGIDGQGGFDSALNILFLAAFPMLLWLFQGSAVLVVTAVVMMGLLSLALRLISRGQIVARAYDAAPIAHRPRLPRKILGSALIGVVVIILAGHHFDSLVLPLLGGLAAMALSLVAFGLDPMKDKGFDNPAALALRNAELDAAAIEQALAVTVHRVSGLGDEELSRRAETAQAMVLRILRSQPRVPEKMMRVQNPARKFAEILGAETDRLEASWESDTWRFARRRFLAKLEVMCESFDTRLRGRGPKGGRDRFDKQADLLLDKMRNESAA